MTRTNSTSSITAKQQANRRRRKWAAILLTTIAGGAVAEMQAASIDKIPMYNSEKTGEHRIRELLDGHPNVFYDQFGMSKFVFRRLERELAIYAGFAATKFLSMDEQLGIFLSTCRSGKRTRDIRFDYQRGPDTVSR
jgi:ferric-dicitrate binding protein FerR (iron transport regulator)